MPTRRLNPLLLGVIGRAQEQHPNVRLYLFVVMSNHMHLILSAPDCRVLSSFMNFINGNLAKEAGRLYEWQEKFWGRRFTSIEILDQEKLMGRVHYLLSHGCKEGMVNRPGDWPGVNCVEALTTGRSLKGVWLDRTAIYLSPDGDRDSRKYETKYEVRLSPLPGFEEMSAGARRSQWRRLIGGIEEEYEKGPPKDPKKIARHPHDRPEKMKKGPRPFCHATTRALRKLYREAYALFVMAYRQARELLFEGDPKALEEFPPGSFIPPFATSFFDPG